MSLFEKVFTTAPLILTEGGVGQRLEREFGFQPDRALGYAPLIGRSEGRRALEGIYRQYLDIAEEFNLPICLLTNTRRVNAERIDRTSFIHQSLIQDYADFLATLASQYTTPTLIGGMTGCKGDAYKGDEGLSVSEAQAFHEWQMERFAQAPIDFLFQAIMPSCDEIVGLSTLMSQSGKPYLVSLMVNRQGSLLDGTGIDTAIQRVDERVDNPPVAYVSNCVHPDILREALCCPQNRTSRVKERYIGLQANAACLEPHELDQHPELQTTDAQAFAQAFIRLDEMHPLRLVGGCCGTDASHIRAIAQAFTARRAEPHE